MAVQLLVNFCNHWLPGKYYLGSKVDSVKLWPNEKFESFYTSNFHKTFEGVGQKSCQKSLHKPCTLVDQKVIVITRHLVFLPCGLGFCSFPWHYDWINYQLWGREFTMAFELFMKLHIWDQKEITLRDSLQKFITLHKARSVYLWGWCRMLVEIELLPRGWPHGVPSFAKNLKKVHIYPNLVITLLEVNSLTFHSLHYIVHTCFV